MIKIFTLPPVIKGTFLDRPNRFLSLVKLNHLNIIEQVHVHDPGRLKELLYPGNKVLIAQAKNKNRKTSWDLICANKDNEWIFVNSAYHRVLTEIILKRSLIPELSSIFDLKAEVKVEHGRLDFLGKIGDKNIWIETKGCTLIKDSYALFPDAPTKRGKKHITTLISLKQRGDRAAMIILIFSKQPKYFCPNKDTDPEFAQEFFKARNMGVEIYPVSLFCDGEFVYFNKHILIKEDL